MLITSRARFVNGDIEFNEEIPFDHDCEVLITFITETDISLPITPETKSELFDQFKESILSKRELEVLELAQQGLRVKEIAHEMMLSGGTTRNYLSSIYKKLKVRNRPEAIKKSIELGLLDPPESKWGSF